MNEDHQEAMALIVEDLFGIQATQVTMLSTFYEGAHFRADEQVVFFPFDKPCMNAQNVREQLVAATHAAREKLALAVAN
jgi:putative heme iron utilization protein